MLPDSISGKPRNEGEATRRRHGAPLEGQIILDYNYIVDNEDIWKKQCLEE